MGSCGQCYGLPTPAGAYPKGGAQVISLAKGWLDQLTGKSGDERNDAASGFARFNTAYADVSEGNRREDVCFPWVATTSSQPQGECKPGLYERVF